jgi:hypothetical protein
LECAEQMAAEGLVTPRSSFAAREEGAGLVHREGAAVGYAQASDLLQ